MNNILRRMIYVLFYCYSIPYFRYFNCYNKFCSIIIILELLYFNFKYEIDKRRARTFYTPAPFCKPFFVVCICAFCRPTLAWTTVWIFEGKNHKYYNLPRLLPLAVFIKISCRGLREISRMLIMSHNISKQNIYS